MPGSERFVQGRPTVPTVHLGRHGNGELHAEVRSEVSGRDCVIVGSISPPAGNVERLTLVAHAARRAGAQRIAALLPYLAYARQDHAGSGESLGLAWAGELLRASGITEVVCVDGHSGHAGELLGLPVTSLSPAAQLAVRLPASWRSQTTFVAPDEGAIERCAELARAAGIAPPIVWAPKRRTHSGVTHRGLIGRPERRAVIVDDILDTGGTLVSCCRALREAGAAEIAVMATHGLFTGKHWRALPREGVQELWITDTVLARRRPAWARVVPVAPLLAPALTGPLTH